MVGDSTGTSAGGASTESTARAARGMAGSASTMAAASPAASKAPRAGWKDTFFNCTWKLSEVQTRDADRVRSRSEYSPPVDVVALDEHFQLCVAARHGHGRPHGNRDWFIGVERRDRYERPNYDNCQYDVSHVPTTRLPDRLALQQDCQQGRHW